jgi:hypothetical protein
MCESTRNVSALRPALTEATSHVEREESEEVFFEPARELGDLCFNIERVKSVERDVRQTERLDIVVCMVTRSVVERADGANEVPRGSGKSRRLVDKAWEDGGCE